MRRGELYLFRKPARGSGSGADPRRQRVFVIVSRPALMRTGFATVICAPVYSKHDGLSTQVQIGITEGLKHESSIHCDELVSIPKTELTHFVGSLREDKLKELGNALKAALGLEDQDGTITIQ